MALSYPLNLPSRGPRRLRFEGQSVVGVQASPLTLEQTVYVWQGDLWRGTLDLGEFNRAEGEEWAAFILALNGPQGTFLMGDPLGTTPRGTWSGASPLVNGAHAAGVKTVAIDGLIAGATGEAGDWLQFGSGSSSRLHKLVQAFTANGSGEATLEIWPMTRAALLDNAAITLASAKGVWNLAGNLNGWDIEDVRIGGISLPIMETRRG